MNNQLLLLLPLLPKAKTKPEERKNTPRSFLSINGLVLTTAEAVNPYDVENQRWDAS
ncbi:MAG: hypothetical protein WCT49_04955 [Candidatus Paceibacterota bacterium]|jgi:hypothetical protein|nr:hypothetical protein [Candidatus Paceibacterota bacterium]